MFSSVKWDCWYHSPIRKPSITSHLRYCLNPISEPKVLHNIFKFIFSSVSCTVTFVIHYLSATLEFSVLKCTRIFVTSKPSLLLFSPLWTCSAFPSSNWCLVTLQDSASITCYKDSSLMPFVRLELLALYFLNPSLNHIVIYIIFIYLLSSTLAQVHQGRLIPMVLTFVSLALSLYLVHRPKIVRIGSKRIDLYFWPLRSLSHRYIGVCAFCIYAY